MRYRLWLIWIYILFFSSGLVAQEIYSNDFLNIGVGARSLGMGKAVVSNETSVEAAYWNPANLMVSGEDMQISAMHAIWFAGVVDYDYMGFGFRMGTSGKSYGSISAIRMGIDDIPNTLHLYGPDGSINYANIRSFSVADYAFLFTYSRQIGSSLWRVGGNGKLIRRILGPFAKSWGGGIDIAVSYPGEIFKFGAVLRDASTSCNSWSYTFTKEEVEILNSLGNDVSKSNHEVIKPVLSTGVSFRYNLNSHLFAVLAADMDVAIDGYRNTPIKTGVLSIDPHIGIELSSRDQIFFRAGISSIQSRKKVNNPDRDDYFVQPNMGIGLNLGPVNINYALAFLNEDDQRSSLSHVFSARYSFLKNDKTRP